MSCIQRYFQPCRVRPSRRRRRTCYAERRDPLELVEATAGKSAIYGCLLGSINTMLTGMGPAHQMATPLGALAVMSVFVSAYSVDRTDRLTETRQEFKDAASVIQGRWAMLAFALLTCITS